MDSAHSRLLFQHAAFGCVLTDGKGVILQANDEAARLLGLGSEMLPGRSFSGFMVAGDDPALEETAGQLPRDDDGAGAGKRVALIQPPGREPFAAMVAAMPLSSLVLAFPGADLCWLLCELPAGAAAGGGATARAAGADAVSAAASALCALDAEIAGHRQTEEALWEARRFNREIIDGAAEGITVYDAELRYVVWNRFMEELTGMPASRVLGRRAPELFPHMRRHGLDVLLQRALQGEVVNAPDVPLELPQAVRKIRIAIRYAPHRDHAGRIVGAIGMVRDITARRQAEEALRESEQRFRSLAAAVPIGIFRTDAAGRTVYANRRTGEILGLGPEEAAGSAWLERLHPEDRERVAATWASALRDGGFFRSEHRFLRPDGSVGWVYAEAAPEIADTGERRGYVGTVTDITDQKQAELDLQRTSARFRRLAAHLESVREEESRKLAAEVHDTLGGSLNMLKLGLAAFLEKMSPHDPARARLDSLMALSEETVRVARLITARLRPRMLDTLGLVAAIRSHADEYSRMTGIRCELQLPQYIRLAPERSTAVFRIVQEALTNAARHAGANALTIKVSKSGTHLVVIIADDGRGVSRADLEKQDSYGILGMHERSQYLGGVLEIAGVPDGGTTVTLRVPFES